MQIFLPLRRKLYLLFHHWMLRMLKWRMLNPSNVCLWHLFPTWAVCQWYMQVIGNHILLIWSSYAQITLFITKAHVHPDGGFQNGKSSVCTWASNQLWALPRVSHDSALLTTFLDLHGWVSLGPQGGPREPDSPCYTQHWEQRGCGAVQQLGCASDSGCCIGSVPDLFMLLCVSLFS